MTLNENIKTLYSTKYLELKSTTLTQDGSHWFYIKRANVSSEFDDAVVIIPVIYKKHSKHILFLETQRPPMFAEKKAMYCIEFPAGLIGDERKGESIIEAAKAELLEETGLRADSIKVLLKNSASSSGCTSETIVYTIAYIYDTDLKIIPKTDGGVIIDKHIIKVDDIDNWLYKQVESNKSITSQTLAGLYLARAEL